MLPKDVSLKDAIPKEVHPFTITWRRGLFCHWPFDPERVRSIVPEPLEIDTREGRAWIGILPFLAANVGPRFVPSILRPTVSELNVRTYVEYDGEPGIYFFGMDVGSRIGAKLARTATGLSFRYAEMDVETSTRGGRDRTTFHSRRPDGTGRFGAAYRPTAEARDVESGSLPEWLLERRRLFEPRSDAVYTATVGHEPWSIQPADATIHANEMFAAYGLPEPENEPRFEYCEEMVMTASLVRRRELPSAETRS